MNSAISTGRALLLGFLSMPILGAACSRGLSKDEVAALVDARVASGIASAMALASASASAAAPKVSPEQATMALVVKLEEIMRSYQPELRDADGSADAFRCITSEATAKEETLAKLRPIIRRRLTSDGVAKKAHITDPKAFRIDFDWRTRMNKPIPAEFGCFNATYGRWTNIASPDFCAHNPYSYDVDFVWKVQVPAKEPTYTYTGTTTAPTKPPELMRRMESGGIALPQRAFCRVADVSTKGGARVVACGKADVPLRFRITGGPVINAGDLVSVPVAGARRDPDGVVFKDEDGWTIDADGGALSLDFAPSQREALIRGGGYDPDAAVDRC